jgi:hypothetical protein
VSEAFLPLLHPTNGRICNIASASGPNFVRGLDGAGKQLFTSRATTWEQLDAEISRSAALTDYEGIACTVLRVRPVASYASPSGADDARDCSQPGSR